MNESILFWAILSMSILGGICTFLFVVRSLSNIFALYRENFISSVGQGIRGMFLFSEAGELFTLVIALAIGIGLLSYFFLGVLSTVFIMTIILVSPLVIFPALRKRRSEEFVHQMPDTLDSISSSLKSGLNIIRSFQQVVKNFPNPTAQEFAQVLGEYRLGRDLNESLDDMAARINRHDVVLFVSAIKISRSVGGNLANTLDTLASTLREKTQVEGKIRALTATGRAQSWMGIVLPVGLAYAFYFFEPEAMSKLFTTPLGLVVFGVVVTMMISSVVLIRRVSSINV